VQTRGCLGGGVVLQAYHCNRSIEQETTRSFNRRLYRKFEMFGLGKKKGQAWDEESWKELPGGPATAAAAVTGHNPPDCEQKLR
jgi:hypothetical protein